MEHGMEASYVRFETQIAGDWERMLAEGDRTEGDGTERDRP